MLELRVLKSFTPWFLFVKFCMLCQQVVQLSPYSAQRKPFASAIANVETCDKCPARPVDCLASDYSLNFRLQLNQLFKTLTLFFYCVRKFKANMNVDERSPVTI